MRRAQRFDKDAHAYIRYIASQRLGLGAMVCRLRALEDGEIYADIPDAMTAEGIRHFAWSYADHDGSDLPDVGRVVEYLRAAADRIMLVPAGTVRFSPLPGWLPTILAEPQLQGHDLERYIWLDRSMLEGLSREAVDDLVQAALGMGMSHPCFAVLSVAVPLPQPNATAEVLPATWVRSIASECMALIVGAYGDTTLLWWDQNAS